jgi:gamma-glutamylcyclotransferase
MLLVQQRLGLRKPPEHYYFAYGANLNTKRFRENFMNFREVGAALLKDYRLEFSLPCQFHGLGFGSVAPAPGSEVWGVLYQLDALSLKLLDVLEWCNYGYYDRVAKIVEVSVSEEAQKIETWLYQASAPQRELLPSSEYVHKILGGARDWKFSSTYIEALEALDHKPFATFRLNPHFRMGKFGERRFAPEKFAAFYRIHDRVREWLFQNLP